MRRRITRGIITRLIIIRTILIVRRGSREIRRTRRSRITRGIIRTII